MQKKRIIALLIQSVLFLLMAETLLRIIFYQQVGKERLAIVEMTRNIKRKMMPGEAERMYNYYLVARPDSSKEVNKLIADEATASNRFEYAPWIDYKNIDFSGKYINTKGTVRATVPESFIQTGSMVIKKIIFLGGSTMYGVNITDRETIAAAFVNIYREQYPHGVSIKVINHGVPGYHSYNELMLFTQLMYTDQKPDAAIVLDGLNNFIMPTAVLEKRPYYYYRLKLASNDKINFRELEHVGDSTNKLFNYPAGFTEAMLADSLAKEYLLNMNRMKTLAQGANVDAFFFVQPNPFYDYPNRKKDPVCNQLPYPIVEKGYAILEKKLTAERNYFFLGNMLHNETGYPFIDQFHYSPAMCRKIAKELVAVVGERLNKP